MNITEETTTNYIGRHLTTTRLIPSLQALTLHLHVTLKHNWKLCTATHERFHESTKRVSFHHYQQSFDAHGHLLNLITCAARTTIVNFPRIFFLNFKNNLLCNGLVTMFSTMSLVPIT